MNEQNIAPQNPNQPEKRGVSKTITAVMIAVILLLIAALVYVLLTRNTDQVVQDNGQVSDEASDPEITQDMVLSGLEDNWPQFSSMLDVQPTMGATSWYYTGVQFIAEDTLLVQFEDGHFGNIAVVRYKDGELQLLELLEGQYDLSQQEYSKLIQEYGEPNYNVTSYTISIFRDGEIISFDKLTEVPENIMLKASIPNGWSVYANEENGFTVVYPSRLETVGQQSPNSVMGTYNEPVTGIYIGRLVFIVRDTTEERKAAQDYIEPMLDIADNPVVLPENSEGPWLAVECERHEIPNEKLETIAVSCSGEGGPAYYALIKGEDKDMFIDGYSGGFNSQLSFEELGTFDSYAEIDEMLATFRFTN